MVPVPPGNEKLRESRVAPAQCEELVASTIGPERRD